MIERFHRIAAQTDVTGTTRAVLLVLAADANRKGLVAMPLREIAELVGVSKTAAERAVTKLVDTGAIAVVDRSVKPVQYRVAHVDVSVSPVVVNDADVPGERRTKFDVENFGRCGPRDLIYPATCDYQTLEEHEQYVRDMEQAIQTGEIGRIKIVDAPKEPTPIIENDIGLMTNAHTAASEGSEPDAPAPASHPSTQADVDRLLAAAEINKAIEPLYWGRSAHRTELDQALRDTGLTLDQVCAGLEGKAVPNMRRLGAVVEYVKREIEP